MKITVLSVFLLALCGAVLTFILFIVLLTPLALLIRVFGG